MDLTPCTFNRNHLQLESALGKGSYGTVYKAKVILEDPGLPPLGSYVAVKVVNIDRNDQAGLESIQREIKMLEACNHPNIVRYFGSLQTSEALWIVMENCGGGSVSDLISKEPLDEKSIQYICAESLKGLEYLHGVNRLHRDIKCGNILLNESGEVKLADLGVANELTGTISKRNTFIGTPHWMAPEIIQGYAYDSKVDIWSMGITVFEMALRVPPWWDVHPIQVIFKISKEPAPELPRNGKFSDKLRDFVQQCLTRDPAKRPAAKRLQKHHVFILEAPRVVPEELLTRIKEVQRRFAERAAAAAARAQAKQPSGPGGMAGGPAAPGGTVVARAPAASAVSTVKVNDGPAGASGTFVDHSGAASGTMVVNSGGGGGGGYGTFVDRSSAGGTAGGTTAFASGTVVVQGDPGGASDYLEALKLAEDEASVKGPASLFKRSHEGSGRRVVGPQEQLEAKSRVEVLKAKLKGQAEGLDNVDLPLLRSIYAAPMALALGPQPMVVGSARNGQVLGPVEVEVLMEVLEAMGLPSPSSATPPPQQQQQQHGVTNASVTASGGYYGASPRPGMAPQPEAAGPGPASLPPWAAWVEERALRNPGIGNLARLIAYHRRMLRDLVVPGDQSRSVRATIEDLERGLRTTLQLGLQQAMHGDP